MTPLRRLGRALRTAPSRRDWLEAAGALMLLGLVAIPSGLATGQFALTTTRWDLLARTAIVVLIVPSLFEEAIFRGMLVPSREETEGGWSWVLLSTALFTAWHPLETLWLPREWAAPFVRADFLAMAALLGLACAVLRRRSGSLWTAVALHWAAVVCWKLWLGGPGHYPI